jgi:hypothetical protein
MPLRPAQRRQFRPVTTHHVLSIPGLSDDDRIAILGTAAKLLGIN